MTRAKSYRLHRVVGVTALLVLLLAPLTPARGALPLGVGLPGSGGSAGGSGAASEPVEPDAPVPQGAYPLGWYDGLAHSAFLPRIASEGLDAVMPYDNENADPAAYLDAAKAQGVQVLMEIPRKFVKALDHASIAAWVARFKTHEALLGWYLADEPSLRASVGPLTPENATALYGTIKAEDPHDPVAISFAPQENAEPYRSALDVIMFGSYPAWHGNPEFSGLASWRAGMNKAASLASTEDGFFPVLQAYSEPKNILYKSRRFPTAAEERYMVFSSLEAGATGVFFWARYRSDATWINGVLKPITAVLNQMQAALAGGRVAGLVTTAHPDIHATTFRTPDGAKTYVVAVHHGPGTIDAPLELEGALAAEPDALLLEAQRRVPVTNGRIQQSLGPYQVKVYRLDG